jgi:hypothetical protein
MYQTLDAPAHVLAFSISGKMTGEDLTRYAADLKEKLAQHEHIGVCFDLADLEDMAADTMLAGMKADMILLSHLSQVGRFAFVTDKQWPESIIRLCQPILPQLHMKRFAVSARDEAIAWTAQVPENAGKTSLPAAVSHQGVRLLPVQRDDLVAFEIDGLVSPGTIKPLLERFREAMARHERIRVLNHVRHYGGIDPGVFVQTEMISLKFKALTKVERYAVVAPPAWMEKILGMVSHLLTDIHIRIFKEESLSAAWAWVNE